MTTIEPGAVRSPTRDGDGTLAVAVFVLIFSFLSIRVTGANFHLPYPLPSPMGLLLSRISEIAMLHLAARAMFGARMTWRSPAATLLYTDLLAAALSSLLWTLTAVTRIVDGVAKEGLFFLSLAALALWIGPILYGHSEIVLKVSVVVAAVEEREGAAALERAAELVKGRRLEGLALTAALAQLDRAMAATGMNVAAVTARLVARLLSCVSYTKFYMECEKRLRRDKDRWIADR